MNPFIASLLVADIVGLAAWKRLSNTNAGQASVVLSLQGIVALCAIASMLFDDTLVNSWIFWVMLILVNLALGIVAFRVGYRALALLGGIATGIAVALLLAHSFLSLPVAAFATALCLGAALLPRAQRGHAEHPPPG